MASFGLNGASGCLLHLSLFFFSISMYFLLFYLFVRAYVSTRLFVFCLFMCLEREMPRGESPVKNLVCGFEGNKVSQMFLLLFPTLVYTVLFTCYPILL